MESQLTTMADKLTKIMQNSTLDWSSLTELPLNRIGKCFDAIEDFAAFRGVCHHWHANSRKDDFNHSSVKKLPWLMVNRVPSDRHFFSILKEKFICRLFRPELIEATLQHSQVWLLNSSSRSFKLINPFSREEIKLPDIVLTLTSNEPQQLASFEICKLVLSSRPDENRKYVVFIAYGIGLIAFWKPDEAFWTEFNPSRLSIQDISFSDQKLYVLDEREDVYIYKFDDAFELLRHGNFAILPKTPGKRNLKFVEITNSSILLVGWKLEFFGRFEVYKLDLSNTVQDKVELMDIAELQRVENFGYGVVLLGGDATMRVDAMRFRLSSHLIEASTVFYPTSAPPGVEYYKLNDRTTKSYYTEREKGDSGPPLFVVPTLP